MSPKWRKNVSRNSINFLSVKPLKEWKILDGVLLHSVVHLRKWMQSRILVDVLLATSSIVSLAKGNTTSASSAQL